MQILSVKAQSIKPELHIHRMAEVADNTGHCVSNPLLKQGD